MIFVSVGTQKFQFNRLLKYIDDKIKDGEINDTVFAQIGNSDYIPQNYEYEKFLDKENFNEKIKQSDLVITHAGVGTIIKAINANKKVIVVPRLVKYKEHVDNHQLEITEMFAKKNFIISNGIDINDLIINIQKSKNVVLNNYQSSNKKIQSIIDNYIQENEKKMKKNVLMVGSNYNTVKGGIVSVIRNYITYCKWDNIKLKFIATHKDGNKLMKIVYFLIGLIRIDLNLIFRNYDVLHIHVSERGSIFRKNIIIKHSKKLSPKTKIILHHHGAEFDDEYNKMQEKDKLVVKKMLKNVDVNIVLSNRLIDSIKSKVSDAKIEVLYNAVNTYEHNMYNSDGDIILFLGRLGKRKGTYDFLEVLNEIKNILIAKKIKVYLCGDGEIEEVRDKVNQYGLEKVVKHIGWIKNEQKLEIFSKTIVNVLPSYNEGLPMTILETMSYGIPNISTNIASIPEVIVDNETGYLINPGDIEHLKDVLVKLIENSNLRCEISNNSYELIKNKFSLDKNVEKIKEIYRNVGN